MKHRLAVLALALAALLLTAPAAGAHGRFHPTPLIFVHGGAGSGAQFESQALRFESNGYPTRDVRVLEYDSTFSTNTTDQVLARLDALVAQVKQETGSSKVDLAGHSLGTFLAQTWLSTPARAANVAHYVNIDGQTAGAPPGGVPTLAIWAGRGTPGRSIVGATNVTVPNQTHVQSATSPETFRAMFSFLTGRAPRHDIVRERCITLAGRAQLFPENTGVGDRALEIWEVRGSTGQRKRKVATLDIADDGSWGPVHGLRSDRHYEFALIDPGQITHHLYFEPFVRSDHLVRLLTSPPDGGVNLLIERSPRHSAATIVRYKEFWGDQGAESDQLSVNGTNLVNAATAPLSKRAIGMFVFDAGSDGVSDVSKPIASLFGLPFLTGVDLFVPAASPPSGTVSVALRSRGAGPVRTVNFPNFASSTDSVSVGLWDFEPNEPEWGWTHRR